MQKWYGVDISNHQKSVNMKAMADTVSWMWHKATEGRSFVDKYYVGRRDDAKKYNLPFGGYHFARPDSNNWRTEADHFLSVIDATETVGPVLDWEHSAGSQKLGKAGSADWVLNFLKRVEDKTGQKPWLYTGIYMLRLMEQDPELANYPLWIAWYGSKDNHAYNQSLANRDTLPFAVPAPWRSVSAWQYSSAGNVAGVSPIDTNVSYVQPWNADVADPPKGQHKSDGFLDKIDVEPGKIVVRGWAVDLTRGDGAAKVRLVVNDKVVERDIPANKDYGEALAKKYPPTKGKAGFSISHDVEGTLKNVAVHVSSGGSWKNLKKSPRTNIVVPPGKDTTPPQPKPEPKPEPKPGTELTDAQRTAIVQYLDDAVEDINAAKKLLGVDG